MSKKKKKKDGYGWLDREPVLNVIEKEEFQKRVVKVFNILGESLGKSFGPYGAPTIISNYPYTHVTKDGYTIMKNSTFDTTHGLVDCVISNIAETACNRLNFTVGDGTTTSIVAINNIYQAYDEMKDWFDINHVLPRDVIKRYEKLKNDIIERLKKEATYIPNDPEEMKAAINKIVYISSNADEDITEMISSLYGEIGYPSIVCELAKDGKTKSELIEGYQVDLTLMDKLYVNTDDNLCVQENVDVLIFDHKITANTYKDILKPVNALSKQRGRHLLVIAPYYDERVISTLIARELNEEYKKTSDVNMILTVCKNHGSTAKKSLSDLAMLLNTTIIDSAYEDELRLAIEENTILPVIRLDDRCIEGSNIVVIGPYHGVDGESGNYVTSLAKYTKNMSVSYYDEDEKSDYYYTFKNNEEISHMRAGYIRNLSIGLDNKAIFKGFSYDENLYNVHLKEAEKDLEDAIEKYSKMGTFNYEVSFAQQRLISLKLKMGVISVGADTELSQKLSKDAVDDAVRAAESAYRYGYIKGCNVTLIDVLSKMINELGTTPKDDANDYTLDIVLLNILKNGFINVYKKVLSNAFDDIDVSGLSPYDIEKISIETFGKNIFGDDIFREDYLYSVNDSSSQITLHDMIISYSYHNDVVFDLEKREFSKDIINSTRTDIEVMKVIVDLMGILITGNQMILTGKHMF